MPLFQTIMANRLERAQREAKKLRDEIMRLQDDKDFGWRIGYDAAKHQAAAIADRLGIDDLRDEIMLMRPEPPAPP